MNRGLRISKAAQLLAVSERTVQRLIAEGKIFSVLVRGARVVPETEIERLLAGAPETAEAGDGPNPQTR